MIPKRTALFAKVCEQSEWESGGGRELEDFPVRFWEVRSWTDSL
jgi:hypothetical protein